MAEAVRAIDGDVDLIVTPELCTTGYDLDGFRARGAELAEPLDGPTVALTMDLAAARRCTLVVGLLERGDGGALYDTAVVVRPDGTAAPYRKTHLYPPEYEVFTPGDQLFPVATPSGRLGPLICFEHAFPEIATTLALDGAQILAIPSAVPRGFEHVMGVRTSARAQDNQLFAIAANLTGGPFFGGSMIVDPRGERLATAGEEETVIRATLDLEEIEREREREPALSLRRPGLYRE
ncbi:MAG: carbon-nitrogen hydrolase [Solirubrobacterales bacterium]|nr:carbon-nitrogen hydrolase [Solirubrobacterales bacterium]